MLWACINGDLALEDVELLNVRNFIVTDGSIKNIDVQRVLDVIRKLNYQKALHVDICAGFVCRLKQLQDKELFQARLPEETGDTVCWIRFWLRSSWKGSGILRIITLISWMSGESSLPARMRSG